MNKKYVVTYGVLPGFKGICGDLNTLCDLLEILTGDYAFASDVVTGLEYEPVGIETELDGCAVTVDVIESD